MDNLKKWTNISLVLLLIIVLIFFAIKRFGIQIDLSKIGREHCGDNICQSHENYVNCCKDCGCPNDQLCVDNKCQENASISTTIPITTTTVQTTIDNASSGGGGGAVPGGGGGAVPGAGTTTETTIYVGCSINYCELCENATVCYDAGCVWCKVSERCRIICKG